MTLHAIHAARLGVGTADSYDDAPRTWLIRRLLAVKVPISDVIGFVLASFVGLFFFDILRGLMLFVAWAGGAL